MLRNTTHIVEQKLENEFPSCGWFGKVISSNKLGWGHESDLGHCFRDWSSPARGKSGVQGHLSGASSSIPTHHPKTLWVVCLGLGKVQEQTLLIPGSCMTLVETAGEKLWWEEARNI